MDLLKRPFQWKVFGYGNLLNLNHCQLLGGANQGETSLTHDSMIDLRDFWCTMPGKSGEKSAVGGLF